MKLVLFFKKIKKYLYKKNNNKHHITKKRFSFLRKKESFSSLSLGRWGIMGPYDSAQVDRKPLSLGM
jgi:hypothetical protein